MASLGVPPLSLPSPSAEGPRYSILLNSHEAPVVKDSKSAKLGQAIRGRPPAIRVIADPLPPPPPLPAPVSAGATSDSPTSPEGTTAPGVTSPRIRFAPLPDPNRPRSLSTGRNVGIRTSEGLNGEREYSLELRNMPDDNYENAVDDEDEMDDEDDDGEYDHDGQDYGGRRRSWAAHMGMGSAWSGTKKLLGASNKKEEEVGYPIKKSVSAGSGTSSTSSMFRTTSNTDKKSLLGSSPATPSLSILGGRRGSSVTPAHKRTGSSGEKTAKMLNGRVYGARRASEAAAMERIRREKNEPAFVEWGASGSGSNQMSRSLGSSGGSGAAPRNKFDDDDGGGMAWVRKRREERERKAREEAEAAAAAGNGEEEANPGMSPGHRPSSVNSDRSSASSQRAADAPVVPLTPQDPPTDIGGQFGNFKGFDNGAAPGRSSNSPIPQPDLAPDAKPTAAEHDSNQHVHSIKIPGSRFARTSVEIDEDDMDEDDGDFDDDDEEDDDDLASDNRMCASAAGIEVVSRHR